MRFLVTMLLILLPLCAQDPTPKKAGGGGPPTNLKVLRPEDIRVFMGAQDPTPKKAGGGGPPTNLKVLRPEDIRVFMGQYVQALGVAQSGGCNFCHVQGDRASDEKPEKVTARMMIMMVNDINSKMSGASLKTVVTCYTCHQIGRAHV